MPRVNVKDKRKQQLIDANIASIAKRGLSETTIAHVSKGAGMSRGIVNFYFTAKESMMRETCQHLAEEYTGAWERALEKLPAESSAEDALRAVVSAHFQSNTCNQKKLAVWVAFWGHASSHAAYKKIVAEADAAFLQKVAGLWGDSHAVSAETFAYELHALIRGSWLNFLLSADAVDRAALEAKCQAFISRAAGEVVMETASNNVHELKPVSEKVEAKKEPAQKKAKAKPQEEEAALGDLFALGG